MYNTWCYSVSAGLSLYQFTHQRCLQIQYLVLLLVLDWTCVTAHTKDVYNTWRECWTEFVSQHTPKMSTILGVSAGLNLYHSLLKIQTHPPPPTPSLPSNSMVLLPLVHGHTPLHTLPPEDTAPAPLPLLTSFVCLQTDCVKYSCDLLYSFISLCLYTNWLCGI